MKVAAPGKLLLFGAYAVLEGATAVVIAVDRHAVADDARAASEPSREVRAAIGDARAPHVDTSALYEGASKLGLGSSAAVLVATLGLLAANRGADLEASSTRDAIFHEARAAHARAQGGGSGVDVAASTYGGALAYTMASGARPLALAAELHVSAFWSGTSARTSDLVARVSALKARNARAYAASIDVLGVAAGDAAASPGDVARLIAAGRATARALSTLGCDADAPLVPAGFAELGALAEGEGGAFYPSGAGGGDVGIWIGAAPAPTSLLARVKSLGMLPVGLGIAGAGVRCTGTSAPAGRAV